MTVVAGWLERVAQAQMQMQGAVGMVSSLAPLRSLSQSLCLWRATELSALSGRDAQRHAG